MGEKGKKKGKSKAKARAYVALVVLGIVIFIGTVVFSTIFESWIRGSLIAVGVVIPFVVYKVGCVLIGRVYND